jgi:hypothetical protein
VTRLGYRRVAAAIVLVTAGASAHAQRSEVCYDAEQPQNSAPPGNDRVFDCPTSGLRTVPQLAQAGWRIVKLTPVSVDAGVRNQLLIKQGTRIFGNGFE